MPSITAAVRADAGVILHIAYPGVTQVKVYRKQFGEWEVFVREGNTVKLDGAGNATAYDFEAELDVAAKWLARPWVPSGGADVETPYLIVPSYDQSWLKDPAFPTRNMPIPIMSGVGPAMRSPNAGTFQIVNRADPVVISTVRSTEQGTLLFHTETLAQRTRLLSLVNSGRVLLFQSPNGYGFTDMYISVGDVQEERVTGLGFVQMRRWTLAYTVVTMTPGVVQQDPAYVIWDTVKTTFATWNDIKSQSKIWRDLLEGT
jgi:hypothetical protein